ncbi:MAG: DUF2927 domain-containing protein [Albidovulum sp.]
MKEGTPRIAAARQTLPAMRLFGPGQAAPASRANSEIARDFIDLSFRLENGDAIDGFARFTGPMTVRITGNAPATASRDLTSLITRLNREAGLALTRTTDDSAAITIEFLPRRQLQARVPDAACFVAPRVSSWAQYRRTPRKNLDWRNYLERQRVAIFIPSDVAPQEVRDCLHEELAQALGPLNDLYRLPDTIFNDDNIHSTLTGFDMLVLRATYAPELRPGMSRSAVEAALPGILARLNPAGQRPGYFAAPTPRAYGDAIARALGPRASATGRVGAAQRALSIAEEAGWQDARTGYAWLTLGRLSGHDKRQQALAAFKTAAVIFRRNGLPLHAAHADMQLAAYALTQGAWGDVIGLADGALPAATAGQNASLMAGLMMLKAAALDHSGQPQAASRLRLDSLRWARYGMTSDAEVRQRLATITDLAEQAEKTKP